MKSMIFYHPHPIVDNPVKGSELRPKMIMSAFKELGYNVRSIVGDSFKRAKAISEIKQEIRDGNSFEFMYGETWNLPIPLTDPHHLPLRPTQDYRFFNFLKKNLIPFGLYYRDFYWQVKELKKNIPFYKYLPISLFNSLDWLFYKKNVDHLFLPSNSISKYLPSDWNEENFSALPPGCDDSFYTEKQFSKDDKLTLFYVGGVKPPYYDLKPLLQTVGELSNVELVLCCRKNEWDEQSQYYSEIDLSNIEIVHASSSKLGSFYKESDLIIDLRKVEGYFKTAMPIKLIEAIGYLRPALLLEGSEVASFVKREDTGWVVNSLKEAKSLLKELAMDKKIIRQKIENLKKVRPNHTWTARAREAASVLSSYR